MLTEFIIPFLIIFIAEMGDKTQITILALSTKFDDPYKIFFGSMLGFLLVDGVAVIFGNLLASYISLSMVHLVSGILFLGFAIFTYLSKDEKDEKINAKSAFMSSFAIIFFAELGDKTQMASLIFATQYNPIIVILAVMLALASVSILAIVIGKKLKDKIDKNKIKIGATILFLVFGLTELYAYLVI